MSQSSAFMSHRLNQDHFVMVDLSGAYTFTTYGASRLISKEASGIE